MTPSPLVVREMTNLEDAARLLSFHHRLLTQKLCPHLFPEFIFSLFLLITIPFLWTVVFSLNRLLLETKYRRLPVVDDSGKLVMFSHLEN